MPCRRQAKQTLERIPRQNSKRKQLTYRLEMMPILEIIQTLQTLLYYSLQPKSQDNLLKKKYFCNFSLVSLSIHPRSRRGAQRMRKDEGGWSRPPKTSTRWSRPLKTFTRWSRPPKVFMCFIRSRPADVNQNKQTLQSCRRQAKQTKHTN